MFPLNVASCRYSCLVVLVFDHRHQPSTSQSVVVVVHIFIVPCPAAAVIVTVCGGLLLIPLSSISGGGRGSNSSSTQQSPPLSQLHLVRPLFTNRHAATTQSRSDTASTVPEPAPLIGGAYGAGALSRLPRCLCLLYGSPWKTLLCFLGRHHQSGDSDGCTAALVLIHNASGVLRIAPPSSSLLPNVDGVGVVVRGV